MDTAGLLGVPRFVAQAICLRLKNMQFSSLTLAKAGFAFQNKDGVQESL